MGLGGAQRSRNPSDASPGAFWLLCRHGQRNSPPGTGAVRKETYLGGEIGKHPSRRNQKQVGTAGAHPRVASLAPPGQFTSSPRPTGFNSGKLTRPTQAQKLNRTGGKFPPTQGPSGDSPQGEIPSA